MSTTLTPPPLPPTPPGLPTASGRPTAPAAPAAPRASSRVVAILAIAAGTVLILGTVAIGTLSALRASAQRTDTFTADAAGITALDIDITGASLTVAYGTEASLRVEGNTSEWRFERDGDTLVVSTERAPFNTWQLWGGGDEAILTLPRALADTTIDASFDVDAGAVHVGGTYGELDLDLSAGSIEVSGSARSLEADVSAGRAALDLADVDQAELTVSAGGMNATLTGAAPSSVTADVSAGRLDLTVPDAVYAVESDRSAGEFRHSLSTDPASAHRITVHVSAGAVILGAR